MELFLATESGQTRRELKALLASLRLIEPLASAPEEEKNSWVLHEETTLSIPSLKDPLQGKEQEQTRESLENLLSRLEGKRGLERQALLTCTLTLTGPHGYSHTVKAQCEGVIAEELRGRNHFGFDSLFMKYDYDKTFAELSEEVKQRISHRAKAFEKLRGKLEVLAEEAAACTTT